MAVGLGLCAWPVSQAGWARDRPPGHAPLVPVALTVGDRAEPLAVDGTPQFGWQPRDPDGDEVQSAYEIRVFRGGDKKPLWDSGKVASPDQSYVAYAGPPLAPAALYSWSVRIWDGTDRASPWAGRALFGTGLADGDWAGAQWIRRTTSGNDSTEDYTLARHEFTPNGSPVTAARVYLTAQRQYELRVDGHVIGRGDSFDYPGEGQYSAFDIAPYVKAGAPFAVGVLYHHWTCTCQGAAPGPPNGPSGMLARIVVDHADGSRDSFVTDGSWRVTKAAQWTNSTLTYRNSDAGDRVERYDARQEIPGWDAVGFDDSPAPWANATVIGTHPQASGSFAHLDAAVSGLSYQTVHPVSVRKLADGTVVADFGKVIAARPTLHLAGGVAGRALTVTTSYRLNNTTLVAPAHAGDTSIAVQSATGIKAGDPILVDAPADGYGAGDPEQRTVTGVTAVGSAGVLSLDAALSRAHDAGDWIDGVRAGTSGLDTQGSNLHWYYTERDGGQTAQPFTYWAWRYLQVDAPGPGEQLGADDISAVVQQTDAPADRLATFHSDNPTLDRVFELMQRSGLQTSQETHVDTPTREKGQFLGDTVDISFANMAGAGERNATQRAIRELVYSQARYWPDGRLNAVYPNGDGRRDIPDYTEMFPIWVMRYYLETGDRATVDHAYRTMRNVADYVWSYRSSGSGLIENLAGGSGQYQYGIIDWPAPMRYGYDMNTSARTVVNAWAVGAQRAVSDAARVLGRDDERATYAKRADDLADAINFGLRRSDGVYVDGLTGANGSPGGPPSPTASQHSSSFAMYFGIAPRADYEALGDYVAGLGMRQGPMTWHVLLHALALADRPQDVVSLLTDPSADGPAKILAQDGTFMWEQWDPGCTTSPCSGAAVSQSSGESLSHGWGSWGVLDVLETLLGVSVTSPGASTVQIAPPRAGLSDAHGSVWTQRGTVAVRWTRDDAGTRLEVDVPDNVRATISLPIVGDETYAGSGEGRPIATGTRDGRAVFEAGSGHSTFAPVAD